MMVLAQVTSRLSVADLGALMSVDQATARRLRENPQAWREHLEECCGAQPKKVVRRFAVFEAEVARLLASRMTTSAGTAAPATRPHSSDRPRWRPVRAGFLRGLARIGGSRRTRQRPVSLRRVLALAPRRPDHPGESGRWLL